MKSDKELASLLGDSKKTWDRLIGYIRSNYDMDELWHDAKPGSYRHNGLRFHRGTKPLISLYAREGFFKACIVLGKKERGKYEERQNEFSDAIRTLYNTEKTFHDGKWLWIDLYDDIIFDDVIRLLRIKRKPKQSA